MAGITDVKVQTPENEATMTGVIFPTFENVFTTKDVKVPTPGNGTSMTGIIFPTVKYHVISPDVIF